MSTKMFRDANHTNDKPVKKTMHMKIDKNLILAVVLITIIMAAGSNQIFLKTSAVVLQAATTIDYK